MDRQPSTPFPHASRSQQSPDDPIRKSTTKNNMRLIFSASRKVMTKHLYNKLDVVNVDRISYGPFRYAGAG